MEGRRAEAPEEEQREEKRVALRHTQAAHQNARQERGQVEGSGAAESVEEHSEKRLAERGGQGSDHGDRPHHGQREPELVHDDGVERGEEPDVDVIEEMCAGHQHEDRGKGDDRRGGRARECSRRGAGHSVGFSC